MPNLFLEKTIDISATAKKVWGTFLDPAISVRMGGEYVSEWEEGSSISWKAGGKTRMTGRILKIVAEKLLKHNVLRVTDEGVSALSSVITYELREHNGMTILVARESFAEAQNDKAFAEALAGWDATLQKLKQAAEG